MKKLLTFALVALSIGLTSCSEEGTACCDCSNNNGLYYGQTEVCHGDNAASQGISQEEFVEFMENIDCVCNN